MTSLRTATTEPRGEGHRLDESGDFAMSGAFAALPWLRHGSSTRGFSDARADRAEELLRFQRRIGLAPPATRGLAHADQQHTANVGMVDANVLASLSAGGRRYEFPSTDAIVAPSPGVAVAVVTADCSPVFLVDEKARAVAVAHAGWQGTLTRIVEATVAAMVASGSKPSDLLAWIGPTVGGCCYEVSVELADRFSAEFQDAVEDGVHVRDGRMLDLVALNAYQLAKAGVPESKIWSSGLCTMHERERFYSYRADQGSTGRIISMIGALVA